MNKEISKKVFLYLFDNFTRETNEVMNEFKLSRQECLRVLKGLETLGLATHEYFHDGLLTSDRKRLPGVNATWWAEPNYDNTEREDAILIFEKNFKA